MNFRVGLMNLWFLMVLAYLIIPGVGCSSKRSGDILRGQNGNLSESDLNAVGEGRYAGGAIHLAEEEGIFRNVHFDFDSSAINDRARQEIDYNRQVLEANPRLRVRLEGHCDERGTSEYNFALGHRRARAVYDMLVSLGISPSRLETISYGAEVPLDPASNELAWAKNRRVHLAPIGGNS